MEWILIWLVIMIVVGVVAANKGRSVIGWLLIAFLLSPLTLLILLALPSLDREPTLVRVAEPHGLTRTCPRCAETIKSAALVCRYCGHEFTSSKPKISRPSIAVGDSVVNPTLGQGVVLSIGDGIAHVQFPEGDTRVETKDLTRT